MPSDLEPRTSVKSWTVSLTFLAVILLWWLGGEFIPSLLTGSLADRALKGDAFGSVNALFSGLAFAGVVLAILMQRDELRLQRQELRLTREELDRQSSALEAQVVDATQQRFDSTFFHMVQLHHQIVEAIQVTNRRGRDALGAEIFDRVKSVMKAVRWESLDDALGEQDRWFGVLRERYFSIYDEYETILGHYFRNLYRIVKFVDESSVPDKQQYVGLLRAQLSAAELGLVFYNLFGAGFDKFLPLVERYNLLEHLPPSSLAFAEHAAFLAALRSESPHPLRFAERFRTS